MSEIKLNTWRYGVVPKLHPEAVIDVRHHLDQHYWCSTDRLMTYRQFADGTTCIDDKRWYRILSLGPPEMPAEELRLPEGWRLGDWEEFISGGLVLTVERFERDQIVATLNAYRPTRSECVREINRLLEGK